VEHLKEYLLPYAISNVAAIFILLATWKSMRLGRLFFVLLFGWAAWTNSATSLNTPEKYLEYADMSLPLYQNIIRGWFSYHITGIIVCIAFGQLLIALGMLLKDAWVKIACIGAIVFLLAIAPLGVGSGFPFSIFVSMAAFLIYRKPPHDYLWKKKISEIT